MTTNQIAYFKAREDRRHNKAQESYQNRNLDELRRHNIMSEGLDAYRTERTYQASIYASDNQRAASKYAADSSRAAAKYSADRSYESSVYSADRHYQASIYSADRNYASSVYSTKMKYLSSLYDTNKRAETENFKAITAMQSAANVARINKSASKYNTEYSTDANERLGIRKLRQDLDIQIRNQDMNLMNSLIHGGFTALGSAIGGIFSLAGKVG